MQTRIKQQAAKDIRERIVSGESMLKKLQADLEVLRLYPPDEPMWSAHVSSAWSSEGEPNWNGEFQAPDLKEAVYHAMMEFSLNARRAYPGYEYLKHRYDHFDLQGEVYIHMVLPNGTIVHADRKRVRSIVDRFNKKAPDPPKIKPKRSGIT